MEGVSTLFACPAVRATPACLWWDGAAESWTTRGCTVANVTTTSITCACDHLTEFATRFAALGEQQQDVFAQNARLIDAST
jgi:uncharacterized membrane protein YgcG